MRRTLLPLLPLAALLATLLAPAPAQAVNTDDLRARQSTLERAATSAPLQSDNLVHETWRPGQAGISGCFLRTAAIYVSSGLDSLQVWDVSDPAAPALTGVLPNAMFQNEAMTCGERRTADGVERFALIGVDLFQVSPGDIQHFNVGGGELIVVDVTDPSAPAIRSRTSGLTSTHTVACVDDRDCRFAYSAGDSDGGYSIFDLRDLDAPKELDGDRATAGTQPFSSPTAGHKWDFDAAGYGTHTGWNGASMWDVSKPRKPKLVTTTGKVGRGEHPDYPGWNDFILHNSIRPNAQRFKPNAKPSLRNGNILLVGEEDYEETDCSLAGSFQTWWVKRLDGRKNAIKPLAKVELADLGTFPVPHGGFCSTHWFDFHPSGLVAIGFYGGGTHVVDVTNPRRITPYGHSIWGGSEVWDARWVPVYKDGVRTKRRTDLLYSIDLVRGLDVYRVGLPGAPAAARAAEDSSGSGVVPMGMVGVAVLASLALGRLRRAR